MVERRYQFTGNRFLLALALLGPAGGAAYLVYDMATDDGTPVIVPVATALLLGAVIAVVARLILVSATICDETYLTVRRTFGTSRIAWPDVQAIEIETNHDATKEAPRRLTVLYDTDGRRRELPFVNDRGVADLDAEVEVVRELWRQNRGADWRRRPGIAERRHSVVSLWTVGLIVGPLAVVVGLVTMMAFLVGGVFPGPFDPEPGFVVGTLLHPVALLLVYPAAATTVTVLAIAVRRRS